MKGEGARGGAVKGGGRLSHRVEGLVEAQTNPFQQHKAHLCNKVERLLKPHAPQPVQRKVVRLEPEPVDPFDRDAVAGCIVEAAVAGEELEGGGRTRCGPSGGSGAPCGLAGSSHGSGDSGWDSGYGSGGVAGERVDRVGGGSIAGRRSSSGRVVCKAHHVDARCFPRFPQLLQHRVEELAVMCVKLLLTMAVRLVLQRERAKDKALLNCLSALLCAEVTTAISLGRNCIV